MIKSFLTFLLVSTTVLALAQTGTSSPYSLSALGELKFKGFTQHAAMGGTSRSQVSANNFSPANPASYANIKFTIFDAGLTSSSGQLQTETASASASSGNFSHFAMAFPFSYNKPMGVSFGTYQYSSVGYDIRNSVNTDTPSHYNLFRGTGGINKVYVGYGVELFKGFRVGANANFGFGNVQALEAKVYPNTDTHFSYSDEDYTSYTGFDFDFGVQYSVQTKEIQHTLAVTFNPSSTLSGSGYRYAETFFGRKFEQGSLTPIDTIHFFDDLQTSTTKPTGFGAGYTINKGDNWALSLEFEQNKWSDVVNNVNGQNFFDNTKYAAGISIVPEPKYDEKENYFKKVRYSAGFRYENLYYNFFNEQINELGISFGLGLPVIKSVRLEEEKVAIVSRVNITAEYQKRGTIFNGLIQENYFNVGIGLNFNDKWFTKRKYR